MVSGSTGIITTVAGTGISGYSGDGGSATSAQLSFPTGVAVDSAGNIYIGDTDNTAVRKVTKFTGIITTLAGTGISGYSGDGADATSAQFKEPIGIAIDFENKVYIADASSNVIRMVIPSTPTQACDPTSTPTSDPTSTPTSDPTSTRTNTPTIKRICTPTTSPTSAVSPVPTACMKPVHKPHHKPKKCHPDV